MILPDIINAIQKELKYILQDKSCTIILDTQLNNDITYGMPLVIFVITQAPESGRLPGNGITRLDFTFSFQVYNNETGTYGDDESGGYGASLMDIVDTIRNDFENEVWQTQSMVDLTTNYGFRLTFSGITNAPTLQSESGYIMGFQLGFDSISFDQSTSSSENMLVENSEVQGEELDFAPAPIYPSAGKIAISNTDAVQDYLVSKLHAGSNITITKYQAGADEYLLISSSGGGGGGGTNWGEITGALTDQTDLEDALNSKINVSQLGAASGAASLDITGVIPLSQIPSSIRGGLILQGAWNAYLNTPHLTSGTGTFGFLYIVTVAGNTVLDGHTSWVVGDSLFFDGSVWQKINGQSVNVNTVFGRIGNIVAQSGDYNATQITGLATVAKTGNYSDLIGQPVIPTITNKIAISNNDTTPDYIINKLVPGSNITITKNNSGSDETISIASSGGGVSKGFVIAMSIALG